MEASTKSSHKSRIKTERTAVRDEARKQQVLANVKDAARNAGIPAEVVGDLWELLVWTPASKP